ncbi:hypothetical protein CWR45_02320 [Oceanobacillus chungangensis]|uniref:DUF1510 domain-containing protein n=2 Tax=Oceanobacillus chungangensis TaxID=1229152 RepID=A0A3D8Q2L8_9BACI|nr:hypothetical protein CWR45_02320 [Oceanobacillus chungangensis]
MRDMDRNTRLNKFEKRRKTTKSITILLIAGAVLIVVLLAFWIFGGGNDDSDTTSEEPMEESSEIIINDDSKSNDDSNNNTEENEEATEDEAESTTPDEEEDTKANNEEVETEPAEPSDDNVEEAFTGDWEPVGTVQTGPHTTTYNEGTADRAELKKASSVATGIAENDMIEWWYENGGEQKVIATVSDNAQTATYRVFLSWIDGEGWQPTKVEKLIVNDRKSN